MSRLDADIDRLYQGPLAEFTAERNALAKRAGAQAAAIRGLTRPTVPAWAVNQLYWQNRPVYDRLIERGDDLRATHTAALRGQRTDLRGAGRAHEEALEEALKAVLALMTANGQPVTDATRQAIATTLRSLPGDEPPGRLARQLQPRGFETLSLAAPQGRVHPAAMAPTAAPSRRPGGTKAGKKDDRAARAAAERIAAAREALAAAGRAVRGAEHVVRREEFEAARAARDAEKAERAVSEAEATLQHAEQALADARRAAVAAKKGRDAAQAKAAKATTQLEAAQEKEQRAQATLDERGE